jgi:hypothetical protein
MLIKQKLFLQDIVYNNDQGAATLSMQSIISLDFNMSLILEGISSIASDDADRIFPETGADKRFDR